VRAPIFAKTRRLAAVIARDRGWDPAAIASWVVLADNRTNRRALAAHAAVLRAKFPIDGRTIRPWLREPTARIDALSFLPSARVVGVRRDLAPVRRVRAAPDRRNRA
jgi:hypothetical protein